MPFDTFLFYHICSRPKGTQHTQLRFIIFNASCLIVLFTMEEGMTSYTLFICKFKVSLTIKVAY